MSSTISKAGSIRVLAGASAVAGLGLLVQPHRAAGWFSTTGAVPADVVVRVLGARQLVQGVVQFARPDPELVLAGAVVDVLHLISMVAAAAIWPPYRRPALASAAVAGVFAGAGAVIVSGT